MAQQGLQSCHGMQEEEASVEKIQADVFSGENPAETRDVTIFITLRRLTI